MKRDPVFDVMKGIGIILVLIGHIPPGEKLFNIIYSFHMPLFFMVAGAFADLKKDSTEALKSDVRRLLVPALVTMAFVVLLSPLDYVEDGNFMNVRTQLLSLLWLGYANTKWGTLSIDSLWFLMALFWARCMFRYLGKFALKIGRFHDELILVFSILFSVGAVKLHGVLSPSPWCIVYGLSALQFYAIGWYLRQHKQPQWLFVIFVVAWLCALQFGGLNMVNYYYRCYPIDVLGAIGATWLVYLISKSICTYTVKANKFLRWLGINSLLVLCVNALDRKTNLVRAIKYVLGIKLTGMSSVAFHYAIEAILVIFIVSVPAFRRIYGAKQWKEIL